jgi:hypothetical protein
MSVIRAKINSNTSFGPQQVSVSSPSFVSANSFKALTDVNVTDLQDGAMIQYDSATDKFITKTEIDTPTGTLKLNGGRF